MNPIVLHVELILVPPPLSVSALRFFPSAPYVGSEHQAKTVPPVPYRLRAKPSATLVREILDLGK